MDYVFRDGSKVVYEFLVDMCCGGEWEIGCEMGLECEFVVELGCREGEIGLEMGLGGAGGVG